MPEAAHIRKCRALIKGLQRKTYFPAALPAYEQLLEEIAQEQIDEEIDEVRAKKIATRLILSRLHDVMRAAQPLVEQAITERIAAGSITDADQTRKTAAGNVFQQMFAYALAQNIVEGNIIKPVIVTMSVSSLIKQYASIRVDEDVLKPDSDVIVYSEEGTNSPIMNFSCKTSFRERAGQTYKWKLMCDLATCTCEHKEGNMNCPSTRYGLSYTPTREIKTCFVTADFYNEISNPQNIAMFNFFDYAYVAKAAAPAGGVSVLSNVVDDINALF